MDKVIDFKKECKELYSTSLQPAIVDVPEISFVAVEGKGDPNEAGGAYSRAIELLYGIEYTIKMAKKGSAVPTGYFDYVVPPLEGQWWFADGSTTRPDDKSLFCWIAMIRLPEFVNEQVFEWACTEVSNRKNLDTADARFLRFREGLCAQCLHIGTFDDEPRTIKLIDEYIAANNYKKDISDIRRHHEIYLSDARKTEPSKLKTILRIPVCYGTAA